MVKQLQEELQELATYIEEAFDGQIDVIIAYGELSLTTDKESLFALLKFLRDDAKCAFTQLIDICGADYPERAKRFDIVYHLLSMNHNQRIRVKAQIGEGEQVPSVTDLFVCADWCEREAFDLYGILFIGHPDLRRLLTDYNFQGHPLRKDFPLTGHVEVRYDDKEKRVVYEPVTLTQAFRDFDFTSPWEGVYMSGHAAGQAMHQTMGDNPASAPTNDKEQEQGDSEKG